MERVEELAPAAATNRLPVLPVSVIIAARNEAHNLPRCLDSLRDAGEVDVVDSHSPDDTVETAASHGAKLVQFPYRGGWPPKKKQWAMDSLPLSHDWVLLLDADEAVTPELGRKSGGRFRIRTSTAITWVCKCSSWGGAFGIAARVSASFLCFAAARDTSSVA